MNDTDVEWSLGAVRRLVLAEVRSLMHWHERQAAALRHWLARNEPPIANDDPPLRPDRPPREKRQT